MSSKFVSAAVIASFLLVGSPFMAADAAAKSAHRTSCTQEAKHAGLKDKKEIRPFVKKCVAERKAAARKAREHKKEMKQERKQEHKPEKPAASATPSEAK